LNMELDLISAFLQLENFQLAWQRVAENKGCAGVDGETIAHIIPRADKVLATLIRQIHMGEYRSLPLRQFWIPKKDGTWRGLGVSTVRDRIVQQALLNVLHPILEPQFEDCSFAYRPGRSHLMAVRQVDYWHRQGYEWVMDADVVKYFDQVGHVRLLAEVAERLPEVGKEAGVWRWEANRVVSNGADFVMALIEQWLSVGVLTKQGLVLPEKGIAQGSVVSPILANVYLDDFDEILLAAGLKLVRYADDFVVLGKTEGQVQEAKELVGQVLTGMGLTLHPEKTRVTNFRRGFRFLGHVFSGDLVVREAGKTKRERAEDEARVGELPKIEVPLDRLVYADGGSQPTLLERAMVDALRLMKQPIPPPLFVALGYGVRELKSVQIESHEWSWKDGMATLYLVQQGMMLRKEQGRFIRLVG
jgi:CRISP-associated protein Cas1